MDRINLLRRFSIAIVLAMSALSLTARTAPPLDHSGRVVDFFTDTPLEVAVKAWPDIPETEREGDCPRFGNSPLDGKQSKADGTFVLKVDPEKNPTYIITYCASGYYSRCDPLNAADEIVAPNPTKLISVNASVTDLRLEREIFSALNNLAYFRSINSERFDSVAQRLGKGRAAGLSAVIKSWNPQSNRTNGTFQIKEDLEKNPIHTLAYRASDHYFQGDIANRAIDEKVLLYPARIIPASLQLPDAKLEREILSALNDLSYLRSINSDRFDSVVKRIGKGRADGLPDVIRAWRAR